MRLVAFYLSSVYSQVTTRQLLNGVSLNLAWIFCKNLRAFLNFGQIMASNWTFK